MATTKEAVTTMLSSVGFTEDLLVRPGRVFELRSVARTRTAGSSTSALGDGAWAVPGQRGGEGHPSFDEVAARGRLLC